jgi:murein DD-endopeptidase MepM/ murein hydrolase activator NlpD
LKQFIKMSVLAILAGILTVPVVLFGQDATNLTIHVVQRGENLFRIAMKYELTTEEIAVTNGITDTSNIVVGQRLIIPLNVAPVVEPQVHIVTAGETLRSIAQAYNKTIDELALLNSINVTDIIYVGQELIIVPGDPTPQPTPMPTQPPTSTEATPEPEAIAPTPVTQDIVVSDDPSTSIIHTVQSGETLFRIGLQYNLTVTDLAQANNLLDPTQIYAGQQLIIPGIEPPPLALDLPDFVTQFQVNPLIFVEGRTGRVAIQTSIPVTVSGQFLGNELAVITQEDGMYHNMLIGIPMFTEPGIYEMSLNITDTSGIVTPITANIQIIAGGYGRQTIMIEDESLLSEAVENEEINLIVRNTTRFTPIKSWTNSLSLPAAATMNGVFGTARSYNGSAFNRFHRGVDFAGAPGTPVLAAADGTVVVADTLQIRGNAVIIDHGWGVYTLYAHQNELYVSPGDTVVSGQVIGTIGSTGRITGPHLHWEVWLNGVNVDPFQWIQEIFP